MADNRLPKMESYILLKSLSKKSLSKFWTLWTLIGIWIYTGTEEPGRLQSMGSQRVEHDWVTELNWICTKSLHISYFIFLNSSFPSEKHPLGLLQGMVCQAQNVWHAQFLWLFPSSKETAAAFSRSGWFLFYTYPTAGVGSGIGVLLVPHLWFLRDHSVV